MKRITRDLGKTRSVTLVLFGTVAASILGVFVFVQDPLLKWVVIILLIALLAVLFWIANNFTFVVKASEDEVAIDTSELKVVLPEKVSLRAEGGSGWQVNVTVTPTVDGKYNHFLGNITSDKIDGAHAFRLWLPRDILTAYLVPYI